MYAGVGHNDNLNHRDNQQDELNKDEGGEKGEEMIRWRWPWQKSQFEEDVTVLLVAMESSLIDLVKWQGKFNQQQQQLLDGGTKIMADIAQIQADLAAQKAKLEALITAFNNLVANQNPGPGPGQVIVNQSDLDEIDAAITGETAEIPDETPKPATP